MELPEIIAAAIGVGVLMAVAIGAWHARRADGRGWRADGQGLHPEVSEALSAVFAGEPERAVACLRRVVQANSEATEVYILLGDLYRELGQLERAVRIHRSVLQRKDLTRQQRIAALSSAARDYEAAGFLDRALGAFGQVAQLAPDDPTPLTYLRTLYEQARAYDDALQVQEKITKLSKGAESDRKIQAFLHDRVGEELATSGDARAARKHFETALTLYPACVPAALHLGDVHYDEGRHVEAWRAWHRIVEAAPEQSWLVLGRLEGLHRTTEDMDGLLSLLRDVVARSPDDWRAPVVLAGHLAEQGNLKEARELLARAMQANPASPTVQRAAWRLAADHGTDASAAHRNVAALGNGEPFLDPRVCLHCRYRTREPTWRCPHCHRWDTFVDERPTAGE